MPNRGVCAQARPAPLRFGRSKVHAWGLHASRAIAAEEFLVEYVGEVIRAELADAREAFYEAHGMDSSYLFRIDASLVIDATCKARPPRRTSSQPDSVKLSGGPPGPLLRR